MEAQNCLYKELIKCGRRWGTFFSLLAIPSLSLAISFPNVAFTLNNAAVTPEGYLDVTKAPYNMDKDGGNASSNTTSLQNAIDDAYQHNLAVLFPAGTYDMNNQLELFQVEEQMTKCHVLVGSAAGARPVIRLQGSNFNNTSSPKPLFFYYCSPNGNGPPAADRAASGYNMVFRGIDIDLNGKAGAIGIKMHAAQGSTIQDVKITANNSHAGIESLCGSGVTHANIHVEGGKYGFYITKNKPMPVLTGITCIGQNVRPIQFNGDMGGALTVVGFHFEVPNWATPLFDLNAYHDDEHLCLIDGSIVITGTSATAIKNRNRSLYLRNVYVKNGNKVIENNNGPNIVDNSGNWTHFDEYNFYHVTNRQLINGSTTSGEFRRNLTIGNASAPPADLISRHLWDESTFPHFEDGNVTFVGPGTNNDDDAARIQNAIDGANGKTVFLKKGEYYLKRSLHFNSDTKLVGVARNLVRLRCHSSWSESSTKPMIITPTDGADATCLIAWLAMQMPLDEGDNITFLNWTAGRHSMVREVHFMKWGNWNGGKRGHNRIEISGSGGGRWYGIFGREAYEQGEHPNHRMFCVNGTSEPLSVYAISIEYQESEVYMSEIRNSSNVSIYGFKSETDLNANEPDDSYIKHTPALGIVNSQNIIVMGQGGHGQLDRNESNHGIIEIAGGLSDHIQIANATGGWANNTGFGIVRDMRNGQVIKKNKSGGAGDPVALYSIGDPSPVAYVPGSSGGGNNGGNNGNNNSGSNLLANGDFETGELSDYTDAGQIITGPNVFSGTYSAEIGNNGSWQHLQQVRPVDPNTDYIISGCLDVTGIGSSGSEAEFMVRFLDSTGAVTGNYEIIATVASDAPWALYSRTVTSPPDAAEVRMRVISRSIPNGTVRIDELVMDTPSLYTNDGTGSDPTTDFTHINGSHMNEFSYTGGKLVATAEWQPWRRVKLNAGGAANWTDYSVDLDVENLTSGTGSKDVTAVLVRCAGGENYYGVMIGTNNKLFIGKKSAGSWTWDSGVDSGANHAAYSLKIDVSGSATVTIDAYVNGASTPTASYTDSNNTHVGGGFGFDIRGYHATFDNMVVKGEAPTGPPPPNNPPVLAGVGNVSVNENATTQVNISASDADNDAISLSATGIPAFGSFVDNGNGTGTISFSPGYSNSGVYNVTVTASDGNGGSDSDSFSVTVNDVNRAPVISAISNQSVNENANISVNLNASDADNDAISFNATGIPNFGSLVDNGNGTGTVSFSPGSSNSGVYTVTVTASDGNGGSASDSFNLTVNDVNRAPVISSISNQSVSENASVSVSLSASDADNDAISFSASGIPAFGSLTDNGDGTGAIVCNPNYSSDGVYPITVTVDDGNGGSNSDSFALTVNNINRAPSISGIGSQAMDTGTTLQINLSASDPDLDSLTLSASGLPGFGSLSDNGDGTGALVFSPDSTDAGNYSVTVTVNDGSASNNTDSTSFSLTVNEAAEPASGIFYENNFDTAGVVTPDFAGSIADWTISGGKLKPVNVWRSLHLDTADAATLTDYMFEVDATTISPGANKKHTAAVMVRYQSSNQFYQIQVDKLGDLYIRKKNSGWTTLASTSGGLFGSTFPRTDSYMIIVSGSAPTTIDVYLNGSSVPALSATDSSSPFVQGPPAFESRGITSLEFDNMVVSLPSGNLLFNGDFETEDLSDWTLSNASQTTVVTGANAWEGAGASGEIICNNSAIYIEQKVPVAESVSYAVNAQININGVFSSGDQVKFKADFVNSTGSVFAWNNVSGNIVANTTGYTNFSGTLLAPAGAVELRIRLTVKNVDSGYVRFDDISVVEE